MLTEKFPGGATTGPPRREGDTPSRTLPMLSDPGPNIFDAPPPPNENISSESQQCSGHASNAVMIPRLSISHQLDIVSGQLDIVSGLRSRPVYHEGANTYCDDLA